MAYRIDKNIKIGNTNTTLEDLINSINNLTPVVLYTNDNGSNGNITLSQSVANFTYIEVYYYTQYNNRLYSNKFYKPNGKGTQFFYLEGARVTDSKVNNTYLFWSDVTFNGNTIQRNTSTKGLTSLSGSYSENNDRVFITKVLGYK